MMRFCRVGRRGDIVLWCNLGQAPEVCLGSLADLWNLIVVKARHRRDAYERVRGFVRSPQIHGAHRRLARADLLKLRKARSASVPKRPVGLYQTKSRSHIRDSANQGADKSREHLKGQLELWMRLGAGRPPENALLFAGINEEPPSPNAVSAAWADFAESNTRPRPRIRCVSQGTEPHRDDARRMVDVIVTSPVRGCTMSANFRVVVAMLSLLTFGNAATVADALAGVSSGRGNLGIGAKAERSDFSLSGHFGRAFPAGPIFPTDPIRTFPTSPIYPSSPARMYPNGPIYPSSPLFAH
jgi:hypothetical protein